MSSNQVRDCITSSPLGKAILKSFEEEFGEVSFYRDSTRMMYIVKKGVSKPEEDNDYISTQASMTYRELQMIMYGALLARGKEIKIKR